MGKSKIQLLREAFEKDPSAENKISLLEAEKEVAEKANADLQAENKKKEEELDALAEVKGAAAPTDTVALAEVMAESTAKAIKKAGAPKLRPTKQFLDKLIKCDEVVMEKSEADPGTYVIGEKLRRGVAVTAEQLARVNSPILKSARAKLLIPEGKNANTFLKNKK